MPIGLDTNERVLVTGVFDVLHEEHINFLKKAKKLGYLVVALESDVRVRQIKGEGRPINDQLTRLANVQALQIADDVFILPEDFSSPEAHRRLLTEVKPTILAVSSHSPHVDRKERLMQEIGGRVVVVHEHNPEISTTKILESQKSTTAQTQKK